MAPATPSPGAQPIEVVDKRRGPKVYILDGIDVEHEAFRLLVGKELHVLVILTGHARGTRGWQLSRASLAEACGCSIDTVDKAIARLEELGWLKRRRRCLPKGGVKRPIRDTEGRMMPGETLYSIYELRSPSRLAEYGDNDVDIIEIMSSKDFGLMRVLEVVYRGIEQQPLNFPKSGAWKQTSFKGRPGRGKGQGGSRTDAAPPSRTDAAPPSRTDAAPPSRTDAAPGSRMDAAPGSRTDAAPQQDPSQQTSQDPDQRTRISRTDPPNPPRDAGGSRPELRADRILRVELERIAEWRRKALIDCRIEAERMELDAGGRGDEDRIAMFAAELAKDVDRQAAAAENAARETHRRAVAKRGYRAAS